MHKKNTTEIAQRFLAENTPTLLQKINDFNSPEKMSYAPPRPYKSFSEHHKSSSCTKFPQKNNDDAQPIFATEKSEKRTAESPLFKNSNNTFDFSLASNSKQVWMKMQIMRKKRELSKGFGISQFHSASTMQNSVPAVTFSKASRFCSTEQKEYSSIKSLKTLTSPTELHKILLPSLKSTKGVTFGFGNRVLIPTHLSKKDLMNPAPNKYNVSENLNQPYRGKSFGVPFKAYSKVYLEYSKQPELDVPGPGYYGGEERKKRKNKLIKDLWGRFYTFEPLKEKGKIILSPNYYSPKTEIVSPGRFKSISFGTGDRKL